MELTNPMKVTTNRTRCLDLAGALTLRRAVTLQRRLPGRPIGYFHHVGWVKTKAKRDHVSRIEPLDRLFDGDENRDAAAVGLLAADDLEPNPDFDHVGQSFKVMAVVGHHGGDT